MTTVPPPRVPDVIKKRGGTPYFHNGKIYDSPPLIVRLKLWASTVYIFLGLYFTTFFTFDSVASARQSPFAVQNRSISRPGSNNFPRPGFLGRGGGGGGGGGGGSGSDKKGPGGGGGFGGRRVGTVGDVRGPECKSCG